MLLRWAGEGERDTHLYPLHVSLNNRRHLVDPIVLDIQHLLINGSLERGAAEAEAEALTHDGGEDELGCSCL